VADGVLCNGCGQQKPSIMIRPLDGKGRCPECIARDIPIGTYLEKSPAGLEAARFIAKAVDMAGLRPMSDLGPPWVLFTDKGKPKAILPAMRPGEVANVSHLTMAEATNIVRLGNELHHALIAARMGSIERRLHELTEMVKKTEMKGVTIPMSEDPPRVCDPVLGFCPDVPMVEKDFDYAKHHPNDQPFWMIFSPNAGEEACFLIDPQAMRRLRDQIDSELKEWGTWEKEHG